MSAAAAYYCSKWPLFNFTEICDCRPALDFDFSLGLKRDPACAFQVSAAAAYYSTGVFAAIRFWKLVAGAIMIIAWLNLR